MHGEWIPGKNAGGCTNYRKTCATNPHYLVEPSAPTTVFFSLFQKENVNEPGKYLAMGYKVSDDIS